MYSLIVILKLAGLHNKTVLHTHWLQTKTWLKHTRIIFSLLKMEWFESTNN